MAIVHTKMEKNKKKGMKKREEKSEKTKNKTTTTKKKEKKKTESVGERRGKRRRISNSYPCVISFSLAFGTLLWMVPKHYLQFFRLYYRRL